MKHILPYRPDLDGLRAIAVVSVIIFHFYNFILPSGYVGVDIFFVISGFLITTIILKDYSAGEFSFTKFYLRRIRRIFPALFTMLFISFLLGFLILTSGDMLWFSRQFYYAALQISNLFFQRTVDYFDENRTADPLLHTWSLGVEEQFYILMPVLIITLFSSKKSKKLPLYALVFLSLVSLFFSQYLVISNQKIAFYSLVSRFWELGAGCLIAFSNKKIISSKHNNFLAFVGATLIAASLFVIKYSNFPGLSALLPCTGAVLIIISGQQNKTLVAKFLSNRILVFIGKMSYSLYLWHFPIIVFYKEYTNQKIITLPAAAILIFIIFIISYCSWRFVEKPFRKHYVFIKKSKFSFNLARHPFFVSSLCIIFFISLNYISKITHGFNFRFSSEPLLQETDLDQYAAFVKGKKCGVGKKSHPFPDINECVVGPNQQDFEVALFGDSHAGHYSQSVVSWAERRGLSVMSFYLFSCPPLLTNDHILNKNEKCWKYRQKVLSILKEKPHIKYVFLGSSWFEYNEEKDDYKNLFRENFGETLKVISSLNKKVIILGRIPNFDVNSNGVNPLKCIERKLVPLQKLLPFSTPSCVSVETSYFVKQQEFESIMKEEVLKYKNTLFFDPFPYFCDNQKCSAIQNNKLLYADQGHLNKNGAQYIADFDYQPLKIAAGHK
ncbi:MAG: acyltransferase [Proteobacteria bacterium]|nr:acyltransferase [Pseudomonadota bacterium]